MNNKTRVAVLAPDSTPLMPMTYKRAIARVKAGKAEWVSNDLQIKCIRLLEEPSERATQDIAIGLDPGKMFSGVGVQSAKATLFKAHLVLPFPSVTKKMTARRLLRRARRGRRIDRSIPFNQRAHRQKRFDNRRQSKLPPSIRANKEMELRVVKELLKLFPVAAIRYEVIKARTNNGKGKGFSPAMGGQKVMLQWLSELAPTASQEGWQTSILRQQLGLAKDKSDKSKQSAETHANDGIALASSHFMKFQKFQTVNERGHHWIGQVAVTSASFRVITRPQLFRRQLHFENPLKGGTRKRKGGTVTPWGLRSGDYVETTKTDRKTKAVVKFRGWIGGYTEGANSVSLYDHNWIRIAKFVITKVNLIKRSTRLCVA